MKNYDSMNLSELYDAWIENWKVFRTGLRELFGNEPVPDPREMADMMAEMPIHVWIRLFESETASEEIRKKMDINKLMAEIQLENAAILATALTKGVQT